MQDERTPAAGAGLHKRVGRGMKRPANWYQLVQFAVVGGSGYVVNLGVFAICIEGVGMHDLPARTLAFVIAVSNNFWWNRHWTFGEIDGHAGFQAARFFVVSILAFLVQAFVFFPLLISLFGFSKILAQAVSVAGATPLNFVGNKMWSFGRGR